MKISIVNKYYAPDTSATSQLVNDLAVHLVLKGHTVSVIASRQLYLDSQAGLAANEVIDGVDVVRLWTTRFGRSDFFGRSVDYLSFYLSLFFYTLVRLKKGQVVICCTDPPLISIPMAVVSKLRGVRLVNWLQDVYPEVVVQLGVLSESGVFIRLLLVLRNWSLRCAAHNVAIGEVMAGRLRSIVSPESVSVIHNWSDDKTIQPLNAEDNKLRAAWGLENKFVVGYSGNLGKAHDVDTILQAIKRLKSNSNIHFLFIGGGYSSAELKRRVAEEGLQNISFKAYQERNNLRYSLTAADLHLITLKPELEGCVVPSKFYGCAAAGRAMIFIGSKKGEIAALLKKGDAGVTVEVSDVSGLVAAIQSLCDDSARCQTMADNARKLVDTELNAGNSLRKWSAVLGRRF